MHEATLIAHQTSYDRVAAEYARRIYDELQHKPLDRHLLDRLVTQVGDLGTICDLGCGPGQVAAYLQGPGAEVLGVDLSPGMVTLAQQRHPAISFYQGNMLALDWPDESWGGVAAFYSIIHIPREEVATALREIRRVLKPGGTLLLAFHVGEQTVHLDEWWGEPVALDFAFFQPEAMEAWLKAAGYRVMEDFACHPRHGHNHRRGNISKSLSSF